MAFACTWLRQAARVGLVAGVAGAGLLAQGAEAIPPTKPSLGTLFYTSAERSSIARARRDAELGSQAGEPAPNLVSVTGLVKRQGGHSTAWINGQAVREGQSIAQGQHLRTTPGGIRLDSTRVRVGETLDLNTHERTDLVQPGAVTIKKP